METVAIVGVGLIGGSFALAIRKAGFKGPILGVSSPATLDEAERLGVITGRATLAEAATQADLIYLSQPISGILDSIRNLGGLTRPDCLITDAGSTKVRIVQHASRYLSSSFFVGGHPMAGKEIRGVSAAEADLFRGRTYVLTPPTSENSQGTQLEKLFTLIETIGAVPVFMSAEEHDKTVALTSHLPQLASTAIAALLADERLTSTQLKVAGPGLLDTTRLAMSSYEIWQDILSTNPEPIREALNLYIDKLLKFRENLGSQQLGADFELGAAVAKVLRRR